MSKTSSPIVNAAEHAWVLHDPRFPMTKEMANCPGGIPPKSEYSGEHLLSEMRIYGIDRTVISHVCYYGRDNRYVVHCVQTWPDRFAGIGLLVGHRLHPPEDPENPNRLETLVRDGLVGLRLSPIYDPDVVWVNDPVSYPLWQRAEELGCVFNFFLGPHQIGQVADMARRHPGVNVVIDHLAMIDIDAPEGDGFGPLLDLADVPNVYIRTSLHNPSHEDPPYRDVWPFLERIYDRFGPKRMLYANFFEYIIMKDVIPFFTADDKEWILGRTAMGLYFKDKT